ncbi:MAG: hypothetical protein ACJAVF_004646 [Paraglaciecola sp.]|jgi:hypothetical protein
MTWLDARPACSVIVVRGCRNEEPSSMWSPVPLADHGVFLTQWPPEHFLFTTSPYPDRQVFAHVLLPCKKQERHYPTGYQ